MDMTTKIAACAAALALSLSLSCRDRGEEPRQAAAPVQPSAPAREYTVRGEIVRVGPSEVTIRHEAIPDFADRSGAVVGMNAMVMPFPLARGVDVVGLAPGARVRFRFVMDWERNRMQIVEIEPLPQGTPLRFDAR
jgi:Cu/Ag efflux protein CusF